MALNTASTVAAIGLAAALAATSAVAAPFLDTKPAGDPAAGLPRPTLPMSREAGRAFRDLEFDIMDLNKDGFIDMSEVKVRQVAATGSWSPNRLAIGMRHNCGADVERCDRAQYRKAGYAEFDAADTDHDGLVTLKEMMTRRNDPKVEHPY